MSTNVAAAAAVSNAKNGVETLEQKVARLERENAALVVANAPEALRLKVSEKGGVSVYGLGRFPVTLYREQWERVLEPAQVDAILRFIDENGSRLKVKGE